MTLIDLARAFFDPDPIAVVITDAQVRRPGPTILYANPAFAILTGRSVAEVLGSTPRFMQGRETRRATLDQFADALSAGRRFHGYLANYRPDGEKYHMEIDCRPLCRVDGTTDFFIAFEREVVRRVGRPAVGARRYEPTSLSNDLLNNALSAMHVFSAT